ncbi:MAG: TIGR00341 family protein [Sulfuricella sp.]|nr:TIGR00341 family protein [Sulfuricella sp.]
MNENGATGYAQKLKKKLSRLWVRHLVGANREEAEQYAASIGRLNPAFVFLVVVSSAIATFGLLLNSVAVIIGAMLIAPLMGPIILLGFSVAMTDINHGIQAAKALVTGVAMAILTAYVIVRLAPFIAPTPEILARTQPNLFDLLVAVASGLAGGYAIVRREVGTVAGVAIATALMPPLATAGFGLATDNHFVFEGAFFLFLTNMIAISFSAAGMAVWYGFGNLRAPRELLWKTLVGVLVLALLSVPLVNSLNQTVSKAWAVKSVEGIIRDEGEKRSWQLGQITVDDNGERGMQINALVFVRDVDSSVTAQLEQRISSALGRRVQFDLNQVLVGERKAMIAAAVTPPAPLELPEREALSRYLKRFLAFPVAAMEIDPHSNAVFLQVGANYTGQMLALMEAERTLTVNLPKWKITLIPAQQPLPEVSFSPDSAKPDKQGERAVEEIVWALSRWKIKSVEAAGSMSVVESRGKSKLAMRRAEYVADQLIQAGVECQAVALSPPRTQEIEEREVGRAKYRVVKVRRRDL